MKNNGRIDGLQALRAIAFFEIFLGHCGIAFFTGAFGVSIFVVLSGFCTALNVLPKEKMPPLSLTENVKSALSKVGKLYGLYLVMLAAAFWLAQFPTSGEAMRRMILDILLLQSFSPYGADYFSYNGVSWYLSMYLFLCIAAPYGMALLSKFRRKQQIVEFSAAVFALMAAAGIYVSVNTVPVGDNFAFWLTYISPFYRILEFLLGGALGWLFCHKKEAGTKKEFLATAAELLAAALFVGAILIFHQMEEAGGYAGICYTLLFTPFSLLLVWVSAKEEGLVLRALKNPLVLWIGNLSGYLFLIHQVVIRWLQMVFREREFGGFRTVLLILGSFLISACLAEGFLWLRKKGKMKKCHK